MVATAKTKTKTETEVKHDLITLVLFAFDAVTGTYVQVDDVHFTQLMTAARNAITWDMHLDSVARLSIIEFADYCLFELTPITQPVCFMCCMLLFLSQCQYIYAQQMSLFAMLCLEKDDNIARKFRELYIPVRYEDLHASTSKEPSNA